MFMQHHLQAKSDICEDRMSTSNYFVGTEHGRGLAASAVNDGLWLVRLYKVTLECHSTVNLPAHGFRHVFCFDFSLVTVVLIISVKPKH